MNNLKGKVENIVITTSCSLLHVPYTLRNEKKLSENILRQIGNNEEISWDTLLEFEKMPTTKVIEKGEPIFMRLVEADEIEYIKSLMK